ncbi:MAG: hypothetical protein BZ138_07355 [Methanosphaera sp. rholeuAM270]|nr:MAG: hypothetical protein BZ138_07355 [Methanosphaera sp. rholeuAM270]
MSRVFREMRGETTYALFVHQARVHRSRTRGRARMLTRRRRGKQLLFHVRDRFLAAPLPVGLRRANRRGVALAGGGGAVPPHSHRAASYHPAAPRRVHWPLREDVFQGRRQPAGDAAPGFGDQHLRHRELRADFHNRSIHGRRGVRLQRLPVLAGMPRKALARRAEKLRQGRRGVPDTQAAPDPARETGQAGSVQRGPAGIRGAESLVQLAFEIPSRRGDRAGVHRGVFLLVLLQRLHREQDIQANADVQGQVGAIRETRRADKHRDHKGVRAGGEHRRACKAREDAVRALRRA